jgi:protein involved in polysaccharide export with SLBB domain
LLAGLAAGVQAQTPEQLELLRRNPELVRQRIQQSGLTSDEIRSRLTAAGYPANLLDAYFSGGSLDAGAARVTESMLTALDALGVPVVSAEGLEEVPIAIGTQVATARASAAGELALFGLNVFSARSAQFQPLLSGPVPPSYRVGPGDVMVLVVTGDVELVHELAVTREGFIVIPQVGQLAVNGLTMEQLGALLRRRLGQSYSGIRTGTTKFDVTVARLRTNQVYVVGEVAQPSAYQLASVATVLNALYAAGGPTEQANFRQVLVRRRGDTVAVFDLYEYLLHGDTRNDIVLEQGDVVFASVRGPRVSISGSVTRPAIYEVKEGESLSDLVAMAGGFRADADVRRVAIFRILPPSERGPGPFTRRVIDVPLPPVEPGAPPEVPAIALVDGDQVVVDAVPPLDESLYVWISGLVHKPGQYPWSEGMTLRELMLLARGPRVGADLREAEIARLPADQREGVLSRAVRVPLDSSYLLERDPQGRYIGSAGLPFPPAGSAPEVLLEPYDAVTIFEQPEFEFQRPVMISGEVMYPGVYALERKTERLSDLVRRAGGLTRTAYVDGARFYRDRDGAGRVNARLDLALANPGGPDDVVLQPRDSLHIPEYIPTVRVTGAVINPTSVLYQQGAGIDYYIENAGGYARNADKGRVSVQFANGSAEVKRKVLFLARSPTPGPGSVVAVAKVPEGEGVNVNQLLGTIAQLLTSAVAVIAIVVR